MNPIALHIEPTAPRVRVHLLIRMILWFALGIVFTSSVAWFLYLVLPPVAAALITRHGGEGYLKTDGPWAVRTLRWLAGFFAYLWLLTDEFPGKQGATTVHFAAVPQGTPTATSALVRLVTSIPAVIILFLMNIAAAFFWIIGALCILVARKLPNLIGDFLEMTLRLEIRLIAYHFSLVDAYPSPAAAAVPSERLSA